jgi:hypothetical protein
LTCANSFFVLDKKGAVSGNTVVDPIHLSIMILNWTSQKRIQVNHNNSGVDNVADGWEIMAINVLYNASVVTRLISYDEE